MKGQRSPKLSPERVALAARLADEGQPVAQGTSTFGMHATTIYRSLAEAARPTRA